MNHRGYDKFKTDALKLFILPVLWLLTIGSNDLKGQNFLQQVNYTIRVTLNDQRHELSAFEEIEYINNSRDTLQFLYFHLWPTAYSCNQTDLAKQLFQFRGKARLFDDPLLKGSIDSLHFKVDNREVKWQVLQDKPDICRVYLNTPLLPGDTTRITTPFHVRIPHGSTSRLGHIGESYQISQWYPKPAVYDQDGWHPISYLDQGEFYSEFGNYDVSITLPSNYVVGATGNLQTDEEIKILNNLATDTIWKNYLGISVSPFPPSSQKLKTLHYKEQGIHDFAWFADKRFHVLKGKVILPKSGKEITTWAMFTDQEAELWQHSITYINQAISNSSELIGEYPYHSFTAVQSALNAGVGMEYPGITVIGLVDNLYSLEEVITHEILHNWFYGALGTNERRYPYMDESITSFYTSRYMQQKYPDKKLWEVYLPSKRQAKLFHIEKAPVQRMQEFEWLLGARSNQEQAVNLNAPDYTPMNYSIILYNKAAKGFGYLKAYMGDSAFDLSIQDYYSNFKFSHPQPINLQNAFESHTSKDLNWFFNDYIRTTKRLDYKIVRLKKQRLLVKNKGELASPLVIAGIENDSVIFEKWEKGFTGKQWITLPGLNYSEIKIDPEHLTPELFRLNNNYCKNMLFPKADPLNAHLLFTFDDPEKHSLNYFPLINWNDQNGFMTGFLIHNGFLIPKTIEYLILPFYTFKDHGLTGFGRIAWNIIPYNQTIRMATLSLEATKFGALGNQDYQKLKTGLILYFRKENLNNPFQHSVMGYYTTASNLARIEVLQKAAMNSYAQFGYQLEKNALINPFTALLSLEVNKNYQKTSFELNYRYSYPGKKQGLDIRLYTGTMIRDASSTDFYSFSPAGRRGREMYLFEGIYPNRFAMPSSSFWSKQMTLSEGALVSPVNDQLGFSRWLVSASFSSNLPGFAGQLAIKPFANLLLNDHGTGFGSSSPLFWEAGLKGGIWNIFEVYMPLVVSKNIEQVTGSFKDRIRFIFQLNSLNQIRLRQRLIN